MAITANSSNVTAVLSPHPHLRGRCTAMAHHRICPARHLRRHFPTSSDCKLTGRMSSTQVTLPYKWPSNASYLEMATIWAQAKVSATSPAQARSTHPYPPRSHRIRPLLPRNLTTTTRLCHWASTPKPQLPSHPLTPALCIATMRTLILPLTRRRREKSTPMLRSDLQKALSARRRRWRVMVSEWLEDRPYSRLGWFRIGRGRRRGEKCLGNWLRWNGIS